MLTLEIKNVRGVANAKVDIGPGITLLAGRNKAGKSSLLTALGALLASERAPITGYVQFDSEHLVSRGEKQGTASLTDGDNVRTAKWKGSKAEISSSGTIPDVSRLCAGLDLWSHLKRDERLKLLAKVLNAAPTIDMLREEYGIDKLEGEAKTAVEAAIKKLSGQITGNRWDEANATCEGEAKQAMGAWRQITSKTWTERGGSEWEPEGLGKDPAQRTRGHLEELRDEVMTKREARSKIVVGVSAERRAELTKLAGELAQARERLAYFEGELVEADAKRQAAALALSKLYEPGTPPPTCACPECGKMLDVSNPAILRAVGTVVSGEELKAQKKVWLDAKQADTIASSGYTSMQREITTVRSWVGQCENAIGHLEELGPESDATAELRAANLDVEIEALIAEGRALTHWLDAKALHESIAMWSKLRGLCAADGLRRIALKKQLDTFNARLAQWGADLRGTVIKIDEGMEVKDGNDEPFRVLSGAERWLSDVLIMLAIAEIEKAPVVVIDEANMLDEQLRGPFMLKVLGPVAQERSVIVACAAGFVEKVPDLGAHGLGKTVWVEEGSVEEFGPNEKAA